MPRISARCPRRALLAAAVIGALVTAPVSASALWQASVAAPAPVVSAATLAQPTTTCTSMPAQGADTAFVRFSWAPIPGATGYTVSIRTNNDPTATVLASNVPTTSYDIRGTLLSGLGLVLNTLLTGGAVYVAVTATNNLGGPANVWSGQPSVGRLIALDSSLGGLLGGLRCG